MASHGSFRAGGLEAKSRTEDETGIVFLQPQHMQHGVYTILSRWWTTRKKELKKQLEMWISDEQAGPGAARPFTLLTRLGHLMSMRWFLCRV